MVVRGMALAGWAALVASPAFAAVGGDCTWNGIALRGKVQVVTAFPDIKVQVVNAFGDLKVQKVNAFADDCGEWEMVNSFPDFTIEFVNAFPDVTIEYVNAFPGLP